MLPRIRWSSLRTKIILSSFVPAAIILTTVAVVSLYAYQRLATSLVIERDRALTLLSARLLAKDLATYTDPLSDQFLSVYDGGMVALDARGKVLATQPGEFPGWGSPILGRVSFYRLLTSGVPVWSDVLPGERRDERVVVAVVPIRDSKGEIEGGFAGLFLLKPTTDSALYRSIEELRRSESTTMYLVDRNGEVIYHSDRGLIGESLSSQAIVQRVIRGERGAVRAQDLSGRDVVASFLVRLSTSRSRWS